MLFIDQPNQVGSLYDTLGNGTLDVSPTTLLPIISNLSISGVPKENETFFVGTFPSLNSNNTANSTGTTSTAVWSFLQTWLEESLCLILCLALAHKILDSLITPLTTTDSESGVSRTRVTIGLAAYFQDQNGKITTGKFIDAVPIHLGTLGIINGQIDFDFHATS